MRILLTGPPAVESPVDKASDLFGSGKDPGKTPRDSGQTSPQKSQSIFFGFVGENTAALESNGLTLITRKLSDHTYRPPPLNVTWSDSKGSRSLFGMILTGDHTGTPIASLASLGEEVRAARDSKTQFIPTNHPVLAQFTESIDAYAAAVEKLHASRWTQGLIHPKSVLFVPMAKQLTVLLPDLGFEWMGEIGEPRWLANHPGAMYWDEPAEVRQKAWIAGTDPAQIAKDTGVAGKLIAECLIGRPLTDNDERLNDPTPFWQAIRKAVTGEYANAGQLRIALTRDVLIDAVTKTADVPTPVHPGGTSGKRWIALAVLLLLLGIAAAVAYIVLNNGKTQPTSDTPTTASPTTKSSSSPTTGTKPTTPTTVPSFRDLGEFSSVSPVIDAIINDLKKTANDRSRDESRLKLADELRKHVEATRNRLINADINKFEAVRQITPIIHNLKLLSKMPPYQDADLTAKEKSCLDYAEKFLQTWQR